MGFCPFRSNTEKIVECNDSCELYKFDENPHSTESHCEIIEINVKLEKLLDKLNEINQ